MHCVLCPPFSVLCVPHLSLQTLHPSRGFTESGLLTSDRCRQCIVVVIRQRFSLLEMKRTVC
uniref:Uncharacterized protein n=1 Tax=Anguilla anguilla TaxID=7936 RepID=A0A0E9XJE4_ANGAN